MLTSCRDLRKPGYPGAQRRHGLDELASQVGRRGARTRGDPLKSFIPANPDLKVMRRRGPWRHLEAVEFATLEWVDWFNHRRLLRPIGDVPPAECEQLSYQAQEAPVMVTGVE